jgi:hypothetical protein
VDDENSNLYKINKIDDDTQKSTPAFFDDIYKLRQYPLPVEKKRL